MCGCEDGEPAEFWHERTVTARKEHRCYECRRPIRPGQQYHYITAKWDHDFHAMHICRRCTAFREAWHDVEGCYPLVGALYEEIIPDCLPEMMRPRPDYRDDDQEILPPNPLSLQLGMRLRAHLGKYGPQLPRRAA